MIKKRWVVIGGGAAGFFGAICLAEKGHLVLILEKHRQVLSKVRISGGGRCNVTHRCFDPKELIKNYPRGSKELLGPFTRFGPKDMREWLQKRNIELKSEEDGRMFPLSDSSQTIIDCFLREVDKYGITLFLETAVQKIHKLPQGFSIETEKGIFYEADCVLFAAGGTPKSWELVKELGHTTLEPIPSLFTFNIPSSPFLDLSGISIPNAIVSLPLKENQQGPLLFTHWGLSGPCVLKLSSFAAIKLHKCNYKCPLFVDFLPSLSKETLIQTLEEKRNIFGRESIRTDLSFKLPKRLWERLLALSKIPLNSCWAQLKKESRNQLIEHLKNFPLHLDGKTTYKEEFVTCGGIALNEVDFQTMQSKIIPGLFFAGESLNIDAVTGGFNFQAAWTTSWIASQS